ncbi:MAG: anti-sigma factor [Acidobacteriia bacterium]|nr:anti-sigma factor [Terriglobia bacterium]
MNCAEFQRFLPDIIGGGRNAEQEAHLTSCSACSGLVSDLDTIFHQARQLQASEEPSPRVWNAIQAALQQVQSDLDLIAEQAWSLQASEEPSPRVWNSIEIALRQEGLIRQPQRDPVLVGKSAWSWTRAWLLPVAATLLVALGVILYQRGPGQPVATAQPGSSPSILAGLPPVMTRGANEDQQLLETIAARAPAMRAAYAENLQSVNDYIRDAEESVKNDPNDEEAQQYLMSAYEQKAMVYEMALDRSLP